MADCGDDAIGLVEFFDEFEGCLVVGEIEHCWDKGDSVSDQ